MGNVDKEVSFLLCTVDGAMAGYILVMGVHKVTSLLPSQQVLRERWMLRLCESDLLGTSSPLLLAGCCRE